MKAYLILEDGHVFTGTSIGSRRTSISEIVFNTSMTGYLEVLTDPSYAGQSVCMTYPLIGNYGICYEDNESLRPWMDGFIVRELSRTPSNFRSQDTIQRFLKRFDIPGIAGIDTRALTRILRESGTMNGMITTDGNFDLEEVIPKLKAYRTGDVVSRVTCTEKEVLKAEDDPRVAFGDRIVEEDLERAAKNAELSGGFRNEEGEDRRPGAAELPNPRFRVALMDFGAKYNIPRNLARRGCEVTVYPAWTSADEILASDPDGIMLANGPGDPKDCGDIIKEIRRLYDSDRPMFAICLGHQLLALATGADTKKMKYGHRGGNHPVKDLATGRVYITSQNHGYMVDTDTVDPSVAEPAFVNVNDGTNEGLHYIKKNIVTVQYHPEASPGPHDSGYLFDRFIEMMGGDR
ncbi:MAG: carbamoyl phosphate synthase small subunit [Bilifractor sp.]|jgi:carbamoyl-phosphate synthase small subunit